MKFFILSLLFAAVSASSIRLGTIKCTYGPSYWCANLKQAKECNAIKHCKEKVWKTTKVSANNCLKCELAVMTAKGMLNNPDFQKQAIEKLEGVCVRFSSLAPECKALIDKYAQTMFKELEKLMANPKAVCTKLGLCQASKDKIMAVLINKAISKQKKTFAAIAIKKATKPVALKQAAVKTSAKCILCEFIADKLDKTLSKKATQKEIETEVKKVCSELPSNIGDECKEFVEEYSDSIIKILTNELNPKVICSTLQLCAAYSQSNDEVCDICTTSLTFLKNILDNATEAEIIDELEQFCSSLPEQLQSECKAVVSQYGLQILKLIASTDAKTICTEIGLCSSKMVKHSTEKNCYLGASYWCSNFENALICKQTSLCQRLMLYSHHTNF